MGYHYKNGVIHAGMIRVIFELGEVKQADGATHFITGSRPPSPLLRPCLCLRANPTRLSNSTRFRLSVVVVVPFLAVGSGDVADSDKSLIHSFRIE